MPIPTATPKRLRSLAREDVYAQLSTWIIEGALRPEEPLRDQDIAERLGVSRTPVREALRRLEDEGLVETALNRWTRVAALDPTRAIELYPVVEALESLALSVAFPKLTAEDLATLHQADASLRLALERHDTSGAVAADTSFHDVWIAQSGNVELRQTLRGLKRKLWRIELAYFNTAHAGHASLDEHAALLDALRGGDREAALLALSRNWQGSLHRLQYQLAQG